MKPFQVVCWASVVIVLGIAASAREAARAQVPGEKQYQEQVRPFLAKHCQECHGIEKPKGDFHLKQLSADFADKANRDQWQLVQEQLKVGAMPPKGKPRPPVNEVAALTGWINSQVAAAETARRATQGRVVLRRLNRIEYQNTVRDLLGIDADLKELLALDSSMDGFDNVGSALHVSSFAMERYLEAADVALRRAIANGPQPPTTKKRYLLKDQHQVKVSMERVYRHLEDGTVVCFSSSAWNTVGITQFYPQERERGMYRFRLAVSGVQSGGKPVTFRVTAGSRGKGGKSDVVGYFDAPADKQAVIEFIERVEPRTTIAILPYGLAGARTVTQVGADKYDGPGLAVHWVEVEGPLNESWPPPSHRLLFGDLTRAPAPIYNFRDRVEVVSKDPEADAERILRAFTRRAFRRTVTEDDVKPFLTLVKTRLAEKHTFEQAMRAGLAAVMVAPEFLFLREKPLVVPPSGGTSQKPPEGGTTNKLDDFALASRLSYFLWSSMPDDELLSLAEQKKLSQPQTLRQQVERLLKSPKSLAFAENFVGQWLNLRDIDFTEPGHILYPDFDHMLKVSMVLETELFFAEVLKEDLSLTNFVASDFTMLNGRLAKHYGIPGVDGWEFKKVKLPPDSHRGGVLTMASVLKVTANGTSTSPVLRGAWVLERILGTPPPQPPPNVPGLEPDTRGATTIRERLAKHREIASCGACHVKIDPPGFALESFDVIGGWRENYRTSGRGEPVIIDGRRMPYLKGPKVDPSDEFQGQRFANIDEFKQLLLKDKDQLARALTEKLVTYGTGGAPETADKPEVEAIVSKLRDKNYGFRTLVHEIVQSRVFQNK